MPARWREWTSIALLLLGWAQAGAAIELAPDSAPTLIEHMDALPDGKETPPDEDAPWQPVALPDRWSASRPDYEGATWYRLIVRFDKPPNAPWAVMLPKVSMNADLWVNGQLVGRVGSMEEPLTRNWNRPLLFQIPQAFWLPGPNRVHVRVKGFAGQDSGLGRIWIGPAVEVTPIFRARAFWQVNLLVVADISIFALALFFFFIWLRERAEVYYGYFAVGSFFWGISNTNMVIAEPPLSDMAWEWLVHVTLIWGQLLLGLFGLRFGGKRLKGVELAVFVFALLAAVVLALVPEQRRNQADVVLLFPVVVVGASGLVAVAQKLGRSPLHDYLLFGAAAAATVVMGGHDWFLKAGYLPYDHAYALPFLAPLLLGSMAWLVAGEFFRAQRGLAQLNRDLGARVEEREKQLRDSYTLLNESERERAVIAERARILRDMHDGVGSHLSAAIRQIEAGKAPASEVAQSLRDSLDQLKLSVDAMTLPAGDINALLASVRYRLQPRIRAAGLSLEWQVDALPPWQSDNGTAMRHLQYMLFEVFSNALQHARAQTLKLSAYAQTTSIVISLSDNGQGFLVAPENALRSLRERAQLIGAELSIETDSAGSRVSIMLPLNHA